MARTRTRTRTRTQKRSGFRIHTALLLAGLAILGGCGPVGPLPGGALEGSVESAPASWAALNAEETIQLECNPDAPYSINIWGVAGEGAYYVAAGKADNKWVALLRADPRVRIKIGERLFALHATQVNDAEELADVARRYVAKYAIDPADSFVGQAPVFRLTGAP